MAESEGHVGAGIIILGIAAFLFVMGIKGTQHQLFPQIFGPPATDQSSIFGLAPSGLIPGLPSVVPAPVAGPDTYKPNAGEKCQTGYWLFPDGLCHKLIPAS